MHLTKILLSLLFFLLPLIHGKVLETLWIPYWLNISGNFEFTKAIFFNIFSSIIFLSFAWEGFFIQKKHPGNIFFILFWILVLSTCISISPFNSLIGDTEKWHTTLLFLNLLGIFYILRNCDTNFLKKMIISSLIWAWIVCIIALKEYFAPTFQYGALANRALGSFWHPNYLSGYLLLLLPFCIANRKKPPFFLWTLLLWLVSITLIFSESIWALVLAGMYMSYMLFFQKELLSPLRKYIFLIILWGWLSAGVFCIVQFHPEKLHSFLSRIYLWETTIKIIFSDWKILIFWAWAETLPYYFNSFKVPELYIFENFWFTADRPHNFLLNIWYHFWIISVGIFFYFIYFCIKQYKNTPENNACLLFLFYGIFHYFSIAGYLILILFFAIIVSQKQTNLKNKNIYIWYVFIWVLTSISLVWGYFSLKLYQAETASAWWYSVRAQELFSHPRYLVQFWKYKEAQKLEHILSQDNLKAQISRTPHKSESCTKLTQKYSSAENHFFCGNIFKELGKDELAKDFYQRGVQKLPDLWNSDSLYWNNYFVKHTISGNRFFSQKFWNIPHILEYLEIENNFIK